MHEKNAPFNKVIKAENAITLAKRFLEKGEVPVFVTARYLPKHGHLFMKPVENVENLKFTAFKDGDIDTIIQNSAESLVLVFSSGTDISKLTLKSFENAYGCELQHFLTTLDMFGIELTRTSKYSLSLKKTNTDSQIANTLISAPAPHQMGEAANM